VPIPQIELHFWNSSLLDYRLELLLAGLLLLWISIVLFRRPVALLMFLASTIGLMSLFYVKYFGYLRHHGWLFIIFIAAVWVTSSDNIGSWEGPWSRLCRLGEKSLPPLLTGILTLQVVGGFLAASFDFRYEFSKAQAAANFIRELGLENYLIVGDIDYSVSAVAGYLERPVYYPRGRRFGTFVIWDQARNRMIEDREVLAIAMELATKNARNVLIILNRPLIFNPAENHGVRILARFTGAIIEDEDFYLYEAVFGGDRSSN
jgi:hypothetical protein